MIALLALLQVATAAGVQPPVANTCAGPPVDKNAIIVCGSRTGESPYRLPKVPQEYERKPIRAQTDAIPGVHTRAHVQSEAMPDGNVAKRLMVTFTLPF